MRPRRAVILLMGLLASGGCTGTDSEDPLPLPRFAAFAAAEPTVTLLGPSRLAGAVTLRASAEPAGAADRARVVAVTFLLDGRPIGSDTTAPYSLEVDAGSLPRGRRRLRVAAVDRLGGRARSAPVTVEVGGRHAAAITASPARGLKRALAALARGNAAVRLAPGRYRLRGVRLASGARLVGSGRRTVIAAPDGAPYDSLLDVRGRRVRVSDLALDGGGPGRGRGRAVQVGDGSADVRLERLSIRRVRQDGVNVFGLHSGVSVQDSSIGGDGTGAAGVYVADPGERGDYRDVSVIRTRIRGFRHHGIHFSHLEHGDPDAALRALALDNRVRYIRDPARDECREDPQTRGCGTTEGGIWSGGAHAAIIGNLVADTRWDGIQTVGSSTGAAIVDNRVRDTGTGIYLEHATNRTLVARNRVDRVGIGMKVEWTYDGVGSDANTFVANRVTGAGEYGLFVDVGNDRNRILGNLFRGGDGHAIVLQGSSDNVVRGNRACERDGDVVHEQSGRRDTGDLAQATDNRLEDNRKSKSCG